MLGHLANLLPALRHVFRDRSVPLPQRCSAHKRAEGMKTEVGSPLTDYEKFKLAGLIGEPLWYQTRAGLAIAGDLSILQGKPRRGRTRYLGAEQVVGQGEGLISDTSAYPCSSQSCV